MMHEECRQRQVNAHLPGSHQVLLHRNASPDDARWLTTIPRLELPNIVGSVYTVGDKQCNNHTNGAVDDNSWLPTNLLIL